MLYFSFSFSFFLKKNVILYFAHIIIIIYLFLLSVFLSFFIYLLKLLLNGPTNLMVILKSLFNDEIKII